MRIARMAESSPENPVRPLSREGDGKLTDLWFSASADSISQGGGASPDPPSGSSWTWDCMVNASASQWVYARPSLNTFIEIGGGNAYAFSGIIEYANVDANGYTYPHWVGQNAFNGVVDSIADYGVVQVTFGWGIEGDNFCIASIIMEVWVDG